MIKEISPSADEVTCSHATFSFILDLFVSSVIRATSLDFDCCMSFILKQVIIVTSSLMKDMNSKIDMYKANAIRVLCRITDGTLLSQIERYLKQAIVDKNPIVASAALIR